MSNHDKFCPLTLPDPREEVRWSDCLCDLIAKVRADQDDRECDHCTDLARLKIADLRAQVEALPTTVIEPMATLYVRRDAVLALLDGATDE